MKRGIRWYLIVSLWTAAAWPVSSQRVKLRRRRSAIYIQPLPNFSPIPMHFSAQYESSSEGSMWTPSRSGELNVYVPPLRPSPLIMTGRPMKTTFDVPLTKSIRVTQERQTTGHAKKVKLRATTENPGYGMLGSLAESTVQTLLNFTPIDDEWKPKTSGHPVMGPSSYFGKDSGTKVDKHLNYTGIRFGKVNSVTRTMPLDGVALKIMKNETNFVMRFTPEDVKYTSLEVKTENVLADSPEIQEEQRALFNRQRPSAQIRKEGNAPYQGHKMAMNSNSDESGISFNGVQKLKNEFREKERQLQGHGSLLHDPGITENMNSDSNKREPVLNQKDYVLVTKPLSALKVETGDKNPIRDYRKYFIEPSNTAIDHRKSNYLYQGFVTYSPPASGHDGMNISARGQNFFGIENYSKNNQLNDAFQISVSNNNNRSDVPHKVDKYFSSAPPYRYKYPIALSNSYVSNGSQEKDSSTSEVPLKVGIEYDTTKHADLVIKNEGNLKFIKQNLEEFRLPQPGPKHQSMVSYVDGSRYRNQNRLFGSSGPVSNTSSFEPVTMLENQTKNSQLKDNDFAKPVITDSFENEKNEEKNVNTFVYSARDRLGEIKNKQRPYGVKEVENKLPPKVFNHNPSEKSTLQLDHIENKNRVKNNISKDVDGIYFQPVLPESVQAIPRSHSQQNKQTSLPWPDKSVSSTLERPTLPDSSREKTKFKNAGATFSTKAQLLPEDSESGIVTPPPVITMNYDSQESIDNKERNRTENYVIQRKPAVLPPRKPKITISTGMLAGILIAALVFLGFLTGSMVYAFHQWKFGRGERPKKKSRNPGFPPEYLDEAFAGNTYIHNNIFLPTPQNPDERNAGDSGSVTGEDEQPSTSRIRRH